MSAVAPQAPATAMVSRPPQRLDAWWVKPVVTAVVLGGFVVYATWAGLQNANYYAAPYLSPFYSPCLSANCTHVSVPLLGDWWKWSPAILILWAPGGFRLTCYYYRKAYYRAFVWAPPACAVPDARAKYFGESRFPLILQNIHRYFFYLSIPILVFLWWDALLAFRFPDGFGLGVGTLVLLANATLLSALHALLSRLPARLRRQPGPLLERPHPLPALEEAQRPQRVARPDRLGRASSEWP